MKGSAKKTAAGEHTCCTKKEVKRGPWSAKEDAKLKKYIFENDGHGCWTSLPEFAGLQRCGKSCRLRWINYSRPEIKHGNFSRNEAKLIIQLQKIHGNKWAEIARQLPGRTDNEIKNFWNSKVKKKKRRSNQNQTFPDDVLVNNDNAGNNYLQSGGAGGLYQNNPTNSLILEQQILYLNLFNMMKENFYYPAVDMLISGPTNESMDMVQPPMADSNDKGKGVVSLDMVQPPAADSIDKGKRVVSLDMVQPPPAADSIDKGKEMVVDDSNEFSNVAQPFNGDGDFLGPSMDVFDDLFDMMQPPAADFIDKGKGVMSLDMVQRHATDSIDRGRGMVSLDKVQPPAADSIDKEKRLVSLDMVEPLAADSIDKGNKMVVDSNEFLNVAQPFNGDVDFLGPSMDVFDDLFDMVQPPAANSIDKGKGVVSLDMVQPPGADSIVAV